MVNIMIVKVSYSIEVDETKFSNLSKQEIRKIIKSMEVGNGCQEYIEENAKNMLELENFNKKTQGKNLN